jgi:sugar phosphate isomerase/epimerase
MTSVLSPQQLGPAQRVLCAGTVTGADFPQLLGAAQAGGFDAISLFPAHYRQARDSGLADADLRAMLADRGLCIAELDPLLNWVPGHAFPTDAGMGVVDEDTFYRIADALGARSLNVVWALPERVPEELLIEAFAALCGRAARHGLLAHIEFLPWAQIDDIEAALRIVRRADRPNGGVMFDSWHHFRSGFDAARLAQLPLDKVMAVQLNDAPRRAEDDLVEETMQRRLLPGAGDIPLAQLVAALREGGCNAPLGVEVFSTELQRRSPLDIGRLAGESLRGLS